MVTWIVGQAALPARRFDLGERRRSSQCGRGRGVELAGKTGPHENEHQDEEESQARDYPSPFRSLETHLPSPQKRAHPFETIRTIYNLVHLCLSSSAYPLDICGFEKYPF